jgi:flagellin-like hook-associated protein FlgL
MAASYSALNMKRANNNLTKSLQRLSSGKRITNPSDDAGGLAVGMKLQSALKRAAASRLNTQNGTSFLQMQDGVLKVAGEILDRMAELKSFWNDISKSDLDRETYNHEFVELQRELKMLQGQKFNGVSLFATSEPDNNPLKIITSDDGLGEHIEMSRTGLFENFKSKYGADGTLNTGSHGQYRQLVGDFTADGGIHDAVPGYTSRNYEKGDVVFVNGVNPSKSGYFMALKNVSSGAIIEDIGSEQSLWIRLADESGNGFAESYPQAPIYDHTNLKYNADGEEVAYLEGDIVKIPAHWDSPGSYLFMEAKADVSRGVELSALFDNNQVNADGIFDFVGATTNPNLSTDGKPLTEFLSANANHPMPSLFTNGGTPAELMAIMNAGNSLTPNPIIADGVIYQAAGDWGVERYNLNKARDHGELVLTSLGNIQEYTHLVKGSHVDDDYSTSMFVYSKNGWFQAETAASSTEGPYTGGVSISTVGSYIAGAGVEISLGATTGIYVASSIMKGNFGSGTAITNANDVVQVGSSYIRLSNAHLGTWDPSTSANANQNETILYTDGKMYRATVNNPTGTPGAPGAQWTDVGDPDSVTDVAALGANVTAQVITSDVATGGSADFWDRSPWQRAEPTTANGGRINRTTDFTNVNNTQNWTRTHYTHLIGKTVSTSYTRGDNLMYQGENYIYTSDIPSDSAIYNGSDGHTNWQRLLSTGAVRKLDMYVDTIGGGGSADAPSDVYFRPNEDLEFVDRLPSGEVRTAGAARRTDSPIPPGDGIYNSADDAFYGGLQAGNDGLYGTMDDFYESSPHLSNAQSSPNIDADADNNKELLDTSNTLADFSVADFVDFIQTLANVRAVNGGTMSRLSYAERILEENEINLGAAHSRIMDTDMAYESTKMARQNVLLQAAASMVTQANQLNAVVLSLLQ